MAIFNISNKSSGADLGNYEGANEQEALDAMVRDAGYRDAAHAETEVGGGEDLIVTKVND